MLSGNPLLLGPSSYLLDCFLCLGRIGSLMLRLHAFYLINFQNSENFSSEHSDEHNITADKAKDMPIAMWLLIPHFEVQQLYSTLVS